MVSLVAVFPVFGFFEGSSVSHSIAEGFPESCLRGMIGEFYARWSEALGRGRGIGMWSKDTKQGEDGEKSPSTRQ